MPRSPCVHAALAVFVVGGVVGLSPDAAHAEALPLDGLYSSQDVVASAPEIDHITATWLPSETIMLGGLRFVTRPNRSACETTLAPIRNASGRRPTQEDPFGTYRIIYTRSRLTQLEVVPFCKPSRRRDRVTVSRRGAGEPGFRLTLLVRGASPERSRLVFTPNA